MPGGVSGGYDDSPLTTIRSYVQGLGITDKSQETRLINELSRALAIGADTEIGQMTIGEALNANSLWTNTIKPDIVGDSFHSRTQNQRQQKKYEGDLPMPPGVAYDGDVAYHNAQNHRWQDGKYLEYAANATGRFFDRLFSGKNPFE